MAFWKKQAKIEQMVEEYLAESSRCLAAFGKAFEEYFECGCSEAFAERVSQVQQCEWAADQKRREVEQEMFRQALIPHLRGDILSLLEALDEVPNECEEVTREIRLQGVLVPGGRGPEEIRLDEDLIRIVGYFMDNNLPIGAMCHGVMVIYTARSINGRRLTAYQGIKPDIELLKGTYLDQEVVVDGSLVTSRGWPDLPGFMREFMSLLAKS